MKFMLKQLSFYLCSLLTTSLAVSAESSVWRVSSGDSEIYLGGTFHLLKPTDFPLPEEFDQAYRDSADLVFETDIGAMQDPSVQQMIMSKGMLQGKTLPDVLSVDTYKTLGEACAIIGLPIEALNGFKPSIVVLTIAVSEMQKLGLTQEGVDMHYYQRGKGDNKGISYLEEVAEQIDFICEMGEGNEDEFVAKSLGELDQMQSDLEQMVALWKDGDSAGLAELTTESMKEEYPDVYQSLIVDRNNAWMPLIKSLFESEKKEFVLVGAAHLVGDDGLLAQFKALGYQIEQL